MIKNTKKEVIILSSLILIFIAIVVLVTTNNSVLIGLDSYVNNWILNHQSVSFYNFMLSLTNLGEVYGTIIILIIFGSFLFLKNKQGSYILALAATSGVILVEIIKYLVQRVRPYNLLETGFSFPSAHGMISTVFLLSSIILIAPLIKNLFMKNIFLIIVSIVFPLVAFSRIYLSVHWTSDVLAGIVLGSISFIFAKMVYCHKKENVL